MRLIFVALTEIFPFLFITLCMLIVTFSLPHRNAHNFLFAILVDAVVATIIVGAIGAFIYFDRVIDILR